MIVDEIKLRPSDFPALLTEEVDQSPGASVWSSCCVVKQDPPTVRLPE